MPAKGIYSDLLLHDMGALLQAPSPASLGTSVRVRSLRLPFFRPEEPPIGSGPSVAGYYGIDTGRIPAPYEFAESPAEPDFPYGKLPRRALDPTNPLSSWDAVQREWRTPPLWGVADSGPYLHDGRAETLDAAIRWHAGEAHESVTLYRSLQPEKRQQLIKFLKSLRSPPGAHQKDDRIANGRQVQGAAQDDPGVSRNRDGGRQGKLPGSS